MLQLNKKYHSIQLSIPHYSVQLSIQSPISIQYQFLTMHGKIHCKNDRTNVDPSLSGNGAQLDFSRRAKQRKGGNISPYDDIQGKFQNSTFEPCFFKGGAVFSACFTPNVISSYWGTIGRLGELIFLLENLIKWDL